MAHVYGLGEIKRELKQPLRQEAAYATFGSLSLYDPKIVSPTTPNFTLSFCGEAEPTPSKELPGRRKTGKCSSSAAQRVTVPAGEKGNRHKCWDTEAPSLLFSAAVGDAAFSLGLNMQKKTKSEDISRKGQILENCSCKNNSGKW